MKGTKWLTVAALAAAIGSAQAGERPVVVELFTSQGCSSCPPAEALFLDLIEAGGPVLPLAFHVDYWDRLGWKDPYSSGEATDRQRRYSRELGLRTVYTPQMVIDGRREAIGSDRAAVLSAVRAAAQEMGADIPVALRRAGDALSVSIGAGAGSATAWLIGYDPVRETAIPRGENAGRTIRQGNVVRSFMPIADWRGAALELTAAAPAGEAAAILLQAEDGRIIGAAVLDG